MKLIIGKINASNTIGYWKIDEIYNKNIKSGDYAIVQNKNDYDLVKILRIVDTNEKYEKFLVENGVSKKVIVFIKRDYIRKD